MIQLECPTCQAVLRVPDSAMGKQGNCPQCQATLIVPVPAGLESATPANSPQPPGDQAVGELFSALASSADQVHEDPVLAVTRRSEAANRSSFRIAAIFLSLAVVGGWLAYEFLRPKMNGELIGQVVSADTLRPVRLPTRRTGHPQLYAEYYKEHTGGRIHINSQLLLTSFEPLSNGLSFRVGPAEGSQLVRVDVLKNQPLRDYHLAHYTELEAVRVQQMQAAAGELMSADNSSPDDADRLLQYRDLLILPAVVDALGYHLAAYIGSTSYPCVGQDNQDRLYFCLPGDATQFEIRPRTEPQLSAQLPTELNFRVRVRSESTSQSGPASETEADSQPAVTPSDSDDAQPPPPDSEPATKPDADGETMADESMNPQ